MLHNYSCFSWWWAHSYQKYVENDKYKYTTKNCAPSWLYLQDYTGMPGQQNIKCGNKMPTRCNRGFYCRSYCLFNMFRAPLCPSSGAQECYKWLLPVVFRVVVFKLLVWCVVEGSLSGLQDAGIFLHINEDARPKSHQKHKISTSYLNKMNISS